MFYIFEQFVIKKVKVNDFRYKPNVAVGVPGGYGSWIVSNFGTMKVVRSSPLRTDRPSLPPGVFLVLIIRG
jgi:hypothetical protein